MNRRAILGLGAAGALLPALARAQTLGDVLGTVLKSQTGGGGASGSGLPAGVTSLEADQALRQALTNGAIASVLKVGKLDGYWADGKIQIPLPKTLADIQQGLKPLGLSGPLDDLHLKVNRAAETAAPKAKTMFVNAIKGMSVEDVVSVLRGGDTAGTTYLRGKTGEGLTALFRPVIVKALDASGAMRSLDNVTKRYGAQAYVGDKPRTNLANFATTKALDGLFFYVGEEEKAIRANPVKRTTEVLRKVFGGL